MYVLCRHSTLSFAAARFTAASQPWFYRDGSIPVQLETASDLLTSPVTINAAVRLRTVSDGVDGTGSGARPSRLLCSVPAAAAKDGGETLLMWPWMAHDGAAEFSTLPAASVPLLGAKAVPCFHVQHANLQRSLFDGIDATPLHRILPRNSSALQYNASQWWPVPMPFLVSSSSAVDLVEVTATGFGVQFPDVSILPHLPWKPEDTKAVDLSGGGIALVSSVMDLNRSAIRDCVAREGGGLFSFSSTVSVHNTSFQGNSASHRGGAVSVSGGVPELTAVLLEDNVVGGSAVFWDNNTAAEEADVSGGGGLFCFGVRAGKFKVQGSWVRRNRVHSRRDVGTRRDVGGGFASSFCAFEILSTEFTENAVGAAAAPPMNSTCRPASQEALAARNFRTDIGGGLYASRSGGHITNAAFLGNSAPYGGGAAVLSECSALRLKESRVEGNVAAVGDGGGIALESPFQALQVEGTALTGNAANCGNGGAIALASVGSSLLHSNLQLVASTLTGNHAGQGGGGVHAEEAVPLGSLWARNTVIAGNTAAYGAANSTSARRLRVVWPAGASAALTLEPGQALPASAVSIEVLDGFGQRMSSLSGVQGRITIMDVSTMAPSALPASQYSPIFMEGAATLGGLEFPIAPGLNVTFRVSLVLQDSEFATDPLVMRLLPCPAGTSLAGTKCMLCEPGTYSGVEGSAECFKCFKGSYANTTGSTECRRCPVGTFASLNGVFMHSSFIASASQCVSLFPRLFC